MATGVSPSNPIGWLAIATGIAGLLGLIFILLFFTVGQPFGTLNDLSIAIAAILSALLAWKLYPIHHAQSPLLSQLALIIACIGALVVVAGSVLVIFHMTGSFLAGLYMAAGNGLIALWLLGLNYAVRHSGAWPPALATWGLVIGAIMALGLVMIPAILRGIDSQESASWVVNYVGQASALGWLLLYPVWCIVLGRGLLTE